VLNKRVGSKVGKKERSLHHLVNGQGGEKRRGKGKREALISTILSERRKEDRREGRERGDARISISMLSGREKRGKEGDGLTSSINPIKATRAKGSFCFPFISLAGGGKGKGNCFLLLPLQEERCGETLPFYFNVRKEDRRGGGGRGGIPIPYKFLRIERRAKVSSFIQRKGRGGGKGGEE